jgi:hypothetical protein
MNAARTCSALALFLCAAAAASAPPPAADTSARAAEVLARTRTTTKTYALYLWNRVTPPGTAPREEWSAEFHSGNLHRVETPKVRLVADCKAGTGFAFDLTTGETVEGEAVAKTGCGVDANTPLLSAEWKGKVATRFGPAERVRLVDSENIRRYDISPEGILLSSVYTRNGPGEPVLIVSQAVALEAALPAEAIFDRASLSRSVVPDRFKRAPAAR